MSKLSLKVVDEQGKSVGVLFLKLPEQQAAAGTIFESAAQFIGGDDPPEPQVQVEKRNFWASDGATYMLAGVFTGAVLLAFSWWHEIAMGAVVAAAALLVGVGLHVLKIILHRPPAAPRETAPNETTIKVEQVSSDGKHWLLEQLDKSITMADLRSVADAVTSKNKWTRSITTKAGLTQGKHQKLQADFVRLHYLEQLPNKQNGYRVTGTGRRFLLQIAGQ